MEEFVFFIKEDFMEENSIKNQFSSVWTLEKRSLKIELEDTKQCMEECYKQLAILEMKLETIERKKNMHLWAWNKVFFSLLFLFVFFLLVCFGSFCSFPNMVDMVLFLFTLGGSIIFDLSFINLRKQILLNYQYDFDVISGEMENVKLDLKRVLEKEKLLLEKLSSKKFNIYQEQRKTDLNLVNKSDSLCQTDYNREFQSASDLDVGKSFVLHKKITF